MRSASFLIDAHVFESVFLPLAENLDNFLPGASFGQMKSEDLHGWFDVKEFREPVAGTPELKRRADAILAFERAQIGAGITGLNVWLISDAPYLFLVEAVVWIIN